MSVPEIVCQSVLLPPEGLHASIDLSWHRAAGHSVCRVSVQHGTDRSTLALVVGSVPDVRDPFELRRVLKDVVERLTQALFDVVTDPEPF